MSKRYHAHVYYTPERENQVRRICSGFDPIWHDHPVGPHPVPMATIRFRATEKEALVRHLEQGMAGVSEGISILIHEDTGDDLRDHTEGAEWLGPPVALDFNHFERIKHEKSAEVFPE